MITVISKIKNTIYSLKRAYHRRTLRNKNFTLFSNDCWGSELYKYFDLQYTTPFIGLYVMAPCYIKFLQNPKHYIDTELTFLEQSKYKEVEATRSTKTTKFPIGKLNDIEIQFMHYNSKQEAFEKWNTRKKRINWSNIVVKFDGSKDASTDELIQQFDALNYSKICLTSKKYDLKSTLFIPNWEQDGAKMFRKTLSKFNVPQWLDLNENIKST